MSTIGQQDHPQGRSGLAASAMAELLKLFGALGVVNVLSLALIKGNSITLSGNISSTHCDNEGELTTNPCIKMDGIAETVIGSLFELGFENNLLIICIFLIFVRLCYGNIIVLEGEYIQSPEEKPRSVSLNHALNALLLMPIFSIMSFYAGVGNLDKFVLLLILILLIDIFVFAVPSLVDTYIKDLPVVHPTIFYKQKISWLLINAIALVFIFVLFIWHENIRVILTFLSTDVSVNIVVVYIIASLSDVFLNYRFYLGVEEPVGE